MLDSALRSGLFLILLAVAFAPAGSASILSDETLQSLEDQAAGLHPWAAWAVEQVPGDDGSGEGGSSSGSGSGSGAGGSGSGSNGPANDVAATVRPAVGFALRTASGVTDQVPDDPLGLAFEQIKPVRDTAEGLPTIVFGEAESAPADGPAPASASVTQVEPVASVPLLVGATAAAAAAITVLWLAGSSGSLGAAGAAGSGSKLAATDLRRLLPFASPLFTRFEKDTVLGHPKREALYALILQDPGVSLQALCDSTGLSRTAVTHHLRLMELQHLIVSKRMGRSRHYYENGGRFGRDQKDAYAVLQNDRSKEVAQFVKQNPGAIQKAICAAVGVQASVAHWHLRRLQEAQIVEAVRNGRTVSYFPGTGLKGMAAMPVPAAAPATPAPLPPAAVPALTA